jgi:hypothetical protein
MAFGDADGAIHLMTAGGEDDPGMFYICMVSV